MVQLWKKIIISHICEAIPVQAPFCDAALTESTIM